MSRVPTITLKRNNDRILKLTITKDGAPLDVTGLTAWFSAKNSRLDSDANAIILKDVENTTDPLTGIIRIPVLAAETKDQTPKNYYFDVLLVDADGKRQSSKTGILILVPEVTDGDD